MESQPHLETYMARPTGRATEISVWHVAVSSDDVKVMTLEQLDDAFRLDVIDTSTPVWKNGMSTWTPLGVVAGIEDETTSTQMFSRQEPAALWPPPAWPPHAKATPAYANYEVAPLTRSPAPPALRPTVPPSGPKQRAAAPAPSVRPATQSARPVAPSARPAPPSSRAVHVVPNFSVPASVPPAAYSIPPQSYARPKSSSGFGTWVLGLAVVAGLLVTLYRNDLLLRAARAAHAEAQYLRIEHAMLGGPSFGTLRSVAALKSIREKIEAFTGTSQGTVIAPPIAQQPAAAAPVIAPPVVPPKPAETQAATQTASRAVDLGSLPVEGATPPPAPTAAAAPTRPLPEAKAPVKAQPAAKPAAPIAVAKKERVVEKQAPVESEPSDALKAAMGGKAAKASSDAEPAAAKEASTKPSSSVPRTASGGLDLKAAMGDAVRRHPPKKKKSAPGSEYDPLNGDL